MKIVIRPPQPGIVSCEIAGAVMKLDGVQCIQARSIDGRVVLEYGYPESGVVVLRSVHKNVRGEHSHTHRLMDVAPPKGAKIVEIGGKR